MGNSELNEYSFNESKLGLQQGHHDHSNQPNSNQNFLKHTFNSPLPTTTQFPTPYSTIQINNMMSNGKDMDFNDGVNNNRSNGNTNNNANNHKTNNIDSSLIENSMLPGVNKNGILSNMNLQPSLALNLTNYNNNNAATDTNTNFSNNNNSNSNNIPNEFLLASPEQFKEFLLESPYLNLNLFNKTPAKTPLRFFAESVSSNKNSTSNGNGNNLFGNIVTGTNSNTPLKNMDLNLMFNSNLLAMTSSPYEKRIMNDIGTPYAKNTISSNSAFTDFQKARKDSIKSQQRTPNQSLRTSNSKLSKKNCYDESDIKNSDNKENTDIYGSSPTTVQLNSSVTKSTSKLNSQNIPKLLVNDNCITGTVFKNNNNNHEMTNIDERLFDMEMNVNMLPVSPTPKKHNFTMNHEQDIRIPELPKMGSFTSEKSLSITPRFTNKPTKAMNNLDVNTYLSNVIPSNTNTLPSNSSNKVVKKTKKQAKFQIIVSNAHRFNASQGYPPNASIKGNKKPKLKRTRSLVVGPTKSKIMSSKSTDDNTNQNENSTHQIDKKTFTNNNFINQDSLQFPNSQ
ncbi:hypothetical protein TPHA_0N00200 [Tetrapisispora phaffii CBS 4417]|uniref:Uncharacterized protein n=1 Tax=Tetrapisispora phaffii (strain ATCC 24235 / CBS 4417 / NBRC 1672 / NRRL Y-8282 / UCD 70-5) TaxID=1071381 RepID=G8C0X3_TETPH|nr:hypothetical protein TPHA_0N00200 [Tetrapisispora phaffii CBS 4417]CCE65801.1 hypothetical protein TPHA_0N00200 [Tetrapisispora phaffii CBS 4417]